MKNKIWSTLTITLLFFHLSANAVSITDIVDEDQPIPLYNKTYDVSEEIDAKTFLKKVNLKNLEADGDFIKIHYKGIEFLVDQSDVVIEGLRETDVRCTNVTVSEPTDKRESTAIGFGEDC